MTSALPRVDEHAVEIDASATDAWDALLARIDGSFSGRIASAYARLVGCVPADATGPRPLATGSTITGFTVTAADGPSSLVLTGRHRFSSYELAFTVEELGRGRTRITAETDATFPGRAGRVYRGLVIASGFHARTVRRVLSSIARDAGMNTPPLS